MFETIRQWLREKEVTFIAYSAALLAVGIVIGLVFGLAN
jgi:hypothetical protein